MKILIATLLIFNFLYQKIEILELIFIAAFTAIAFVYYI